MPDIHSIYDEDNPRQGASISELDVINSPKDQKTIGIADCEKDGFCQIFGPLGKRSDGVHRALRMFDGDRHEAWPAEALHPPYRRIASHTYALEVHKGGELPVRRVIEFSNDGRTATQRSYLASGTTRTRGGKLSTRHYHLVSPTLDPAPA